TAGTGARTQQRPARPASGSELVRPAPRTTRAVRLVRTGHPAGTVQRTTGPAPGPELVRADQRTAGALRCNRLAATRRVGGAHRTGQRPTGPAGVRLARADQRTSGAVRSDRLAPTGYAGQRATVWRTTLQPAAPARAGFSRTARAGFGCTASVAVRAGGGS